MTYISIGLVLKNSNEPIQYLMRPHPLLIIFKFDSILFITVQNTLSCCINISLISKYNIDNEN